ncbi:MAG: hypothetical protein ACI9LO_000085 [Planctomycetota bacterium]|jgi:hypothetical protein
MLIAGFALGVYLLPIITAPQSPDDAEVMASASQASYRAQFVKDIAGSDFLHWAEGELSLSKDSISFNGSMSPGPDYQLYLTKQLVETEAAFLAIKDESLKIGPVKTFDKFILSVPGDIPISEYSGVIIWCESFAQFISAAKYQ